MEVQTSTYLKFLLMDGVQDRGVGAKQTVQVSKLASQSKQIQGRVWANFIHYFFSLCHA